MTTDWRELYAANQATIRSAMAGRELHSVAPPTIVKRRPPTAPRPGGVARFASAGAQALIHIPGQLDPLIPAPLVCLLHGCTQDPASFAAATVMNEAADRHGFVVVYPGQDRGSNSQGCWNWFLPAHQRRGAGEPAAIAQIVGELIETDARCTIDRQRVYVAGLSSGGAMAAILGACYPDQFAAVGVHSGLAYRSATDMASAFAVMARGGGNAEAHGRAAYAAMGRHARPVPSIVIHGSADRTVAPDNAHQVLRQAMAANHLAAPDRCDNDITRPTASWHGQDEPGHRYTRSHWHDNDGALMHELLQVEGLGHAWSGGAPGGSYTDPRGPSATEEMLTFFELRR
jgi:poly(hydroxyalkanoate) depolymerase family esterase